MRKTYTAIGAVVAGGIIAVSAPASAAPRDYVRGDARACAAYARWDRHPGEVRYLAAMATTALAADPGLSRDMTRLVIDAALGVPAYAAADAVFWDCNPDL